MLFGIFGKNAGVSKRQLDALRASRSARGLSPDAAASQFEDSPDPADYTTELTANANSAAVNKPPVAVFIEETEQSSVIDELTGELLQDSEDIISVVGRSDEESKLDFDIADHTTIREERGGSKTFFIQDQPALKPHRHPPAAPAQKQQVQSPAVSAKSEQPVVAPPLDPRDTSRMYTILVADDEPDTRFLMEAMLGEAYYRIIQAADGIQALAMYYEQKPDMVILDVQMPGKSGLEVCGAIKADRSAYTPVFLVTCLDDPFSKIEGLKQGADDYIGKPFFTEELQIKVASFLKIKILTEELIKARDEAAEQEKRLTMKLYDLGKL